MPDNSLIRLTRVCKTYYEAGRRRDVLDGVSVAFAEGKFIAIQGRSGSGKSTLLNLLAGIDIPDSGEVRIKGKIVNQLNEHQRTMFRRQHIGFVFQAFNLIPTLTVGENLMFPLELNGISFASARDRVNAILTEFSLADRLHSYPDRLSGGEQQRVAIARAIVHNPAIVLADEPTGNVDIETERHILTLLQRLPREHNITVIAATHSPEVANIADTVCRLERGQLTA